jgi:dihydrolipoamide dehydrogenase
MGAFDISEDFIALTLVAMQPKVLVEEVKELIAHTDPEVPWVGLTEDQAKAQGIKVKKGLFPWAASGRAIANGRDEGVTKLLFDDSPEAHGHGKILGGGIGMAAEVAHGSCTDLPPARK